MREDGGKRKGGRGRQRGAEGGGGLMDGGGRERLRRG